jgi:hypothetical protein
MLAALETMAVRRYRARLARRCHTRLTWNGRATPREWQTVSERARRGRLTIAEAMVASAILAVAVGLIAYAVLTASSGRAQSRLPDEIEQISPADGDKVLNQVAVVVDLQAGYGGRLEIDGFVPPVVSTQQVEPSGEQPDSSAPVTTPVDGPDAVRFDAGTNTLSFQPRPGATIERFSVGRHMVKVTYWKLIEGEVNSRSYTWFFDVTV